MMVRKLTLLFLSALLVLAALPVRAEGMPDWEYPLSPEILDDFDEYIILANRQHLLASDYAPNDLVNTTCKKSSDAGKPELRQAANDAINAMFAAAQQDGPGPATTRPALARTFSTTNGRKRTA